MPRDAVCRTANVGTVGINGLISVVVFAGGLAANEVDGFCGRVSVVNDLVRGGNNISD